MAITLGDIIDFEMFCFVRVSRKDSLNIKFKGHTPNSTSLHSASEGQGRLKVVGEAGGSQAVLGVVCSLDNLLHVLELDDLLDWTEYLTQNKPLVQ